MNNVSLTMRGPDAMNDIAEVIVNEMRRLQSIRRFDIRYHRSVNHNVELISDGDADSLTWVLAHGFIIESITEVRV